MIPGRQNGRDVVALEILGTRVLGIFEQAVLETLVGVALLGAEDARDQPHHGLEQHHRRDLAAGEHIVAD